MEVTAQLNQLRMAPRKVRLVANLIKGLEVRDAKIQLDLLTKKSSDPLLKLLNSAVANAKNNFKLEEDNLVISKILVNGGPTIKRWFPRAMGRAFPIKKRTCSVILVLSEIEVKAEAKGKKAKKEKHKEGAHHHETKKEEVKGAKEKKEKKHGTKKEKSKKFQA